MFAQDAVELGAEDLTEPVTVSVSVWEPAAAIGLRLDGRYRTGRAYERRDFTGGRIAFRIRFLDPLANRPGRRLSRDLGLGRSRGNGAPSARGQPARVPAAARRCRSATPAIAVEPGLQRRGAPELPAGPPPSCCSRPGRRRMAPGPRLPPLPPCRRSRVRKGGRSFQRARLGDGLRAPLRVGSRRDHRGPQEWKGHTDVRDFDEPEQAPPWRPEHGPPPTVWTWPLGHAPGMFVRANGRWRYAWVQARHEYRDGRTVYHVHVDLDRSLMIRSRFYYWPQDRLRWAHPGRAEASRGQHARPELLPGPLRRGPRAVTPEGPTP